MTISDKQRHMGQKGLKLLKAFEGLRLEAYQDGAGVWTIGYGHTGPDVYEGLVITGKRAEELLQSDLDWAEKAVSRYIKVPIRQTQFDALVSLTFNIGGRAFRKSTVARRLNSGDDYGAADAILMWNKITDPNTGELIVSPGLARRRKAERELFLSS